ncbi:MAG: LysR family transcriptional regulator [Archangium sp.]
MDTVERLKIFVRVAESGTFSGVASELGLGQPAVSKAIGALEERFGVRLLHRNTRGLSLTEAGEAFYERGLAVIERFDELDGTQQTGARRRVRVACPMAFGTLRLIKLVAAFNRLHPEIEIDLRLSDTFVDLVEDGVDVAFRFGALNDSSYLARKLGDLPRIVVASREYLRRAPPLRTLDDLAKHQCVANDPVWKFGERTMRVGGALKVDNFLALREAVLAGAGVGIGGTVTFFDGAGLHPKLKQVLTSHALAPMPVHLVFQKDRFLPTRVRTFIDHFVEVVAAEPWIQASRTQRKPTSFEARDSQELLAASKRSGRSRHTPPRTT